MARYNINPVGGMALDSNGNIFALGWEGSDMVTFKYNSSGQLLWRRNYTPPALTCQPNVIACDREGSVYVGGNIFRLTIVKYDSSGNQKWIKTYDSPFGGSSGLSDIEIDEQNNIYTSGGIQGPINNGTVLMKLDKNGNQKWLTVYNPNGNSAFSKIVLDKEKNIYGAGSWDYPSSTPSDILSVKFDSNGVLLWERAYDYNSTFDIGWDLDIDENSNPIVIGNISSQGFCTLKYLSNGNFEWVNLGFPGPVKDIVVDNSSNVYVAGWDHPMGYYYTTVKYDSSGMFQWVNYEIPDGIYLNSMAIDDEQNVYVTGGGTWSSFLTVKYSPTGERLWSMSFNDTIEYKQAKKILVDKYKNVYLYGGWGSSSSTENYFYLIKYSQTTSVNQISTSVPKDFKLYQNYPNPFNPNTTIKFSLAKSSYTIIRIYDSIGRQVKDKVSQTLNAGTYETVFHSDGLSSGIYYYSLFVNGEKIDTKKFVLLK